MQSSHGSAKEVPGRVIGEGWHRSYGGLHAEREALADCRARGEDPRGATMYISLEPCAHTGKQPPCAEALIEAGLARVVYAAEDPSEKTAGKGPERLREAGIDVVMAPTDSDVAELARLQNQPFRKHARTGLPWVLFKMAMSSNGLIAGPGGFPMHISGPESQALVHSWRAELDAIAVGIGTVLKDDPLLTARPETDRPVRQPLRIVFDSTARLPLESRLIRSLHVAPLLVIFGPDAPGDRVEQLEAAGAKLHVTGLSLDHQPGKGRQPERVDLFAALQELGDRGVSSLLLEGGPRLAGAMFAENLIDEVRLFIAPVTIEEGPAVSDGENFTGGLEVLNGLDFESRSVGGDELLSCRLRTW